MKCCGSKKPEKEETEEENERKKNMMMKFMGMMSKMKKMHMDGGPVCSICLNGMCMMDKGKSDALCQLNCSKKCIFHTQCMNEWV